MWSMMIARNTISSPTGKRIPRLDSSQPAIHVLSQSAGPTSDAVTTMARGISVVSKDSAALT